MHPVTAQGIVAQQIGDLHMEAAAQRRARKAGWPRRHRWALRRSVGRPAAARVPGAPGGAPPPGPA